MQNVLPVVLIMPSHAFEGITSIIRQNRVTPTYLSKQDLKYLVSHPIQQQEDIFFCLVLLICSFHIFP